MFFCLCFLVVVVAFGGGGGSQGVVGGGGGEKERGKLRDFNHYQTRQLFPAQTGITILFGNN